MSSELFFSTDPALYSQQQVDALVAGLRGQINGLRFEQDSIGSLFEVRNGQLPADRVICRVEALSGTGFTAGTDLRISIVRPKPVPGLSEAKAKFADLFVELARDIEPYISYSSISSPDDLAAVERSRRRLSGLVGIPAEDVLADVVNRIKDGDWFDAWSMRHYGTRIESVSAVHHSTPFIILSGDPGTGKSVLVHQLPALLSDATQAPTLFLQLNGRLRGNGIQGCAGNELVSVFDSISRIAGKYRVSTLVFLDEAEAVAGTRAAVDISSGTLENNAIVDGLIVALDAAMASQQAKLVFICASNLLPRMDPAIVRRATVYQFARPDRAGRRVILQNSLGDALEPTVLDDLNSLLDRPGIPLTAADVLSQVVAAAVREAARRDTPIDLDHLRILARSAVATPPVTR